MLLNTLKNNLSRFHFGTVVMIVLTVLESCQYNPHAYLLTTKKPSPKDVVGHYILDSISLPPDILIQKRHIEVELHSDGSFSAINIPPDSLGAPGSNFFSQLLSGQGVWQMDEVGILDPGNQQIWGVTFEAKDGRFHSAEFSGDKPPYGLIFTLGDPDDGYAIFLKRKD